MDASPRSSSSSGTLLMVIFYATQTERRLTPYRYGWHGEFQAFPVYGFPAGQ